MSLTSSAAISTEATACDNAIPPGAGKEQGCIKLKLEGFAVR
jgi:hypothetical protein